MTNTLTKPCLTFSNVTNTITKPRLILQPCD